MQWFALIGRETALVQAELAMVSPDPVEFMRSIAIGDNQPPNWTDLGGVIRAGEIIAHTTSYSTIPQSVISTLATPPTTGKINIGLSSAHLPAQYLHTTGKILKKLYIQTHNKRPRIIFSQTSSILNAGHIQGGKLLKTPNCELFFIQHNNRWLIGKTTWQQDIAAYTKRDRDRPSRDAKIGMLPPKLAQIMLNLAQVSSTSQVYDPFCGTGVILTETLIKKAHIAGSDVDPEMVNASLQNLHWFKQHYHPTQTNFTILQADAQTLRLPATTTHIVSEGYLGNPNLGHHSHQRLNQEAATLNSLYKKFFTNVSRSPMPLTIVIALPVWFANNSKTPIHLPIIDDLSDMGYTVEQFAPDYATILVYRRPHQTVGRAIIKLKKG